MTCAIHQAYFLPWLGYFSKLCFVDKFIVLDHSDFTKGFYYDRTKYVSHDGQIKWLSMPIGQHFQQSCMDIQILDKRFLSNFLKTIEGCYAKADFYKKDWPALKNLIELTFRENEKLVDINLKLIEGLLNLLNIPVPEFVKASRLTDSADRTQRIILLCEQTHCDAIIIGDGASIREHDWDQVTAAGILVLKQDFFRKHPIYKQVRRQRLPFEKGVSIIDCILNTGFKHTKARLMDNIYKPQLLEYVK